MPVYRVTVAGKEYTVEVSNPRERPVHAVVDGEPLEVWVEEESPGIGMAPVVTAPTVVASPAPQAPARTAVAAGDVTAPLPGVVTVISVKVGDAVKPGQDLCILEAMKMNNPIRATFGGVVKTVYVTIGQQVQHGTPLFLIAD
ncbi:MAG: biotin/lipoyl-binding protein [Anaerolineae bacterium]|nr:biotin/lipoyl-binding protein [Anaerolineae bacterium]